MDTKRVIEIIETAFLDVPRAEISLRQFVLTDKKGMSGEITDEEWESAGKDRVDSRWEEIPDDEIIECDCLLAHMEAQEFRYFLPAYMRFSLKNIAKPAHKNMILGSTIFCLTPSTKYPDMYVYTVQQLSLLDDKQKSAVRAFLKCMVELANVYGKRDAELALKKYWQTN